MKTLASVVLGAFLTLFGVSPDPVQSIKPLTWEVTLLDGSTAQALCTAWAIHRTHGIERTRWITAAHCYHPDTAYQIGDDEAHVISMDSAHDIAAFSGPDAPGLLLADLAYTPEDVFRGRAAVSTLGFPWGWTLTIAKGIVSNPALVDEDINHGDPLTIYQLAGAPGASGSPVFDSHGRVVGIIQLLFSGGYLGGTSFENLRAFVNEL